MRKKREREEKDNLEKTKKIDMMFSSLYNGQKKMQMRARVRERFRKAEIFFVHLHFFV
jgi:hypothetical protein